MAGKSKEKKISRDEMIAFIKKNNYFYSGVDFFGHNDEQLERVFNETIGQMNGAKKNWK